MNNDEKFSGFEWDEGKSERCRQQRGFSFRDASRVFDKPYSLQRSPREHAEERFETIGIVDDLTLFVIWTARGQNRRIISADMEGSLSRALAFDFLIMLSPFE